MTSVQVKESRNSVILRQVRVEVEYCFVSSDLAVPMYKEVTSP